MSSEVNQLQQMKPYLIAAGVLFVILLVVVFWPTPEPEKPAQNTLPTAIVEPAPNALLTDEDTGITDMVKPDVLVPPKEAEELRLGADTIVEEFVAEEVPLEIPLDTSDASVKSALLGIAESPIFGKLLVNDGLIQKFVINVHSLASEELADKNSLITPPAESFKTYQQAERTWIDRASYLRYNGYVDALESVDPEALLSIYDTYKDTIVEKYSEISRPGANFDNTLINAIDELLDTPMIPVPIEVYSDSVMYKFKDTKIEALSAPQKQLIRTGPENMRRIKDVLRLSLIHI